MMTEVMTTEAKEKVDDALPLPKIEINQRIRRSRRGFQRIQNVKILCDTCPLQENCDSSESCPQIERIEKSIIPQFKTVNIFPSRN